MLSLSRIIVFPLVQGPTGVTGLKGARGAQGAPVSISNICCSPPHRTCTERRYICSLRDVCNNIQNTQDASGEIEEGFRAERISLLNGDQKFKRQILSEPLKSFE